MKGRTETPYKLARSWKQNQNLFKNAFDEVGIINKLKFSFLQFHGLSSEAMREASCGRNANQLKINEKQIKNSPKTEKNEESGKDQSLKNNERMKKNAAKNLRPFSGFDAENKIKNLEKIKNGIFNTSNKIADFKIDKKVEKKENSEEDDEKKENGLIIECF